MPHPEPLFQFDANVEPLAPPAGFVEQARGLGVEFEEGDIPQLGRYLAMLLAANQRLNLTAITDPAEAWTRHILDSLSIVPILAQVVPEQAENSAAADGAGTVRVIDVGTGGGVPGVPLAIVMPQISMTLLEVTGKKAQFLREVVRRLNLANTSVVSERAEKIGQDHRVHREKYDLAIARALGPMAVLAELTVPLVRPGGFVLAVKGARAAEELQDAGKALGLLGARHVQTIETPTGKIVVLEKTIRTPRLYPRRDGEPKRSPLGVERRPKGERAVEEP